MLDGIRVLDLTDERGHLAAEVFASFGAEVIAIEPPGGQPARHLAPFAGDVADPERSLVHWAANRAKRSVVLDLQGSATDRERFLALARTADVLFETAAPGELDSLGLGHQVLAEANPQLVHVSITPFGSDGPKAQWQAPDLVAMASAGQLLLCGDADRAPVRCAVPQAWFQPCGDAADAALIALWDRAYSGVGRHCDISAQQSIMQSTQSMVLAPFFNAPLGARIGGGMRLGPLDVKLVWPCQDGTVSITFLFGAAVGPFSRRLFEWVYEEGGCDEYTRDKDWVMFGTQLHTGEETVEEFDRLKDVLQRFCLTKTKQELFEGAMQRKLLIAPASTIEDVFGFEHFAVRDYWDHVDTPALGRTVRYPGPVVKPSTGRPAPMAAAPALGEGNDEVLSEASLARRPSVHLPASGPGSGAGARRPLEGLKVLDFMWSLAGPSVSRVLADHGATVVRIESSNRIEMGRTLSPFFQDKPDPEGSAVYLNANAGKLGLCLDPTKPEGKAVVEDLVRWADVVTEAYSPGAMGRWGLGYDRLREINPNVVMLSSSLVGQVGPLASFAGFGNLGAAMAGFFHTTGWPDRICVGPYGGYTDYLSPRMGVAALMAALLQSQRTGEGCYLDVSQTEGAMWSLGPAFLDYDVNGRVWDRAGNTDRNHAPHLVAPCAGADRWIAVVCETDAQWQRLCELAGFDAALRELSRTERLARAGELDELISAWTASQDATELAARLQAAGVPAHGVDSAHELAVDPQLQHRGHWLTVEHAVHGPITIEAPRIRIEGSPVVAAAAPSLGQHAYEILTEILGYDPDRIAELAAAEALE
ncbi:MAG: CoA transferase [Acidimicrobiales bacterium]|nr:CoA transferase [Acidimicrobiales bacterium]